MDCNVVLFMKGCGSNDSTIHKLEELVNAVISAREKKQDPYIWSNKEVVQFGYDFTLSTLLSDVESRDFLTFVSDLSLTIRESQFCNYVDSISVTILPGSKDVTPVEIPTKKGKRK